MEVLGRDGSVPDVRESTHVGHLGRYRARDGSRGGRVGIDLERPHAALVVGKRGSGKSHTLGVLAAELAAAPGVFPLVVDPMAALGGLGERVAPAVRARALPGRAWCELLGLDPAGAPGTLVWRAATECNTFSEMRAFVADADAPGPTRRAAANHLRLAASWDVFDESGVDPAALDTDRATVLALDGLGPAPGNAVVRAAAAGLYRARESGALDALPWLLVDEAHAFLDGVAAPALRRLLTRGRQPGVSLVAATQRPSALPGVAVSQSDLLVVHRLTGAADRSALASARPSYSHESLAERMPTAPGEALVFDDATEHAHAVQVRERADGHDGASPRASEVSR